MRVRFFFPFFSFIFFFFFFIFSFQFFFFFSFFQMKTQLLSFAAVALTDVQLF